MKDTLKNGYEDKDREMSFFLKFLYNILEYNKLNVLKI